MSALVDDLGEPFFALNPELVFVYHNRDFAQLAGRAGVDLTGRTFLEVFPEDASSHVFEKLHHVFKTHEKTVFEAYCTTTKRWLEYRLTSSLDRVSGLVEDITERRLIQWQVEQAGWQATSTIACAGMGVARLSLDGTWEFVNERGQQILGYNHLELRDRTLDDVCRYDYKEQDTSKFVDLICDRQSFFTSEICVVNKIGENVWIHLNVSLVRAPNGQPLSFAIIMYDIGERKASDESLKFALEAAQMSEWDYDATSDETRRSARFNEIFGVVENQKTWSFRDFLFYSHDDDRALLGEAFRRAITGGEELNVEVRLAREPRWISLRGKAYLNQQGRVVRMAGLVTDVTRDKNTAIELYNAKLAAEDANREKSYFLANMSHEIRTPLGAILGFADVLRDRKLRPATREKYLDIVTRNGRSLAALIDDILDLSKVESGHLEIVMASENLFDVILDILNLLRIKADAKTWLSISPGPPMFLT